ncbi:Putative DD34D transposase, partial [Caligus rogercresseyi]
PIVENIDKIMEIVESDRYVSTVSIAEELTIAQKTVWNHLNKAGYKKKLDVWVPHELTQKNLIDRISICYSLLNCNKIDPFLKRIVTGDEKWVTYENVKRKRSWSNPGESVQTVVKPGLTVRKVLLCVWWDWQGIIYYELLPYRQTPNSNLYCQQLDCLNKAIAQKRPALVNRRGIVFHQDNARPHTSLVARHKLRELGWEVLIHPPYCLDLAPSDYYLFLSMVNYFASEKLASREACENRLSHFFANRDEGFYERGIMKLPSKWQQVMEQNGAYLN